MYLQGIKGNDNFNGVFDFFEWSAPYYLTPEEVVEALDSLELTGKKIAGVHVIGFVREVGGIQSGAVYWKIREAGIDPGEKWWETYPHLDDVMVPWKVEACEPVQFVFDDGTTLEILPIGGGGARIGVNTVPAGLTEGLNHPNFDANCFFAEAIGKEFRSIEMKVEKKTKRYINSYSLENGCCSEECRSKYRIVFDLEYPYHIELVRKWESYYAIEMYGYGWKNDLVPYARVKASQKKVEQIFIANGMGGGGTFWINPICGDPDEDKKQFSIVSYGMSVDESYVAEYLSEFLFRHFDPSIQDDEWDASVNGQRVFDWYGGNLYSFDSMRLILKEIAEAVSRLENEDGDTVAVDFYKRFSKRMEAMMRLPGRDTVSFAGP